jgi:peptide deformylase
MLREMEAANGAGLAANQVGAKLSLFVTNKLTGRFLLANGDKHDGWFDTIICNPTWKPTSSGFEYFVLEGCLSFPGWIVPVKRYDAIMAEYQTWEGKRVKVRLTEFAAQVFQHETDHLEGTSFLSRLTEEQRETIKKHYKEN